MTTFTAQSIPCRGWAGPSPVPLDLTKHVYYQQGMILGVSDFTQEYAYLAGRDMWQNRDLAGYGTVCGLKVTREITPQGSQVIVTPGVAVSPQGQMIRVPDIQCAKLNDWLALSTSQQLLENLPGSPQTDIITLQVVLRYSDCATDIVPIPGEPCRSENDSMVNSRLQDDFLLELRPINQNQQPPAQLEEDVIREIGALLHQIQVTDNPSLALSLDQFQQAIRSLEPVLEALLGSQTQVTLPSPPTFTYGSLPPPLYIPASQVSEYLRTAMRIWVTELRPHWQSTGCGNLPNETYVLLADLLVPVKYDQLQKIWLVDDTLDVVVDETRRPILVSTRFLQELQQVGPPRHPFIVAAGQFESNGTPSAGFPIFGGLQVTQLAAPNNDLYLLQGAWFNPNDHYIVKGTPLGNIATALPTQPLYVFDVIRADDPNLPNILASIGMTPQSGIVIRVRQVGGAISIGFMVEISQL